MIRTAFYLILAFAMNASSASATKDCAPSLASAAFLRLAAQVSIPAFEMRNLSYRRHNAKLAVVEYEFRERAGLSQDQVFVNWLGRRTLVYQGEVTAVPFNHGGFAIPSRIKKAKLAYTQQPDNNRRMSFTTREGTVFVYHNRHIQNFPEQPEDYDHLYVVSLPYKFPDSRYFSMRKTDQIEIDGKRYAVVSISRESNGLINAGQIPNPPSNAWFSVLLQLQDHPDAHQFGRIITSSAWSMISEKHSADKPRLDGRELTVTLHEWPYSIGRVSVPLPRSEDEARAAVATARSRWGSCELIQCAPKVMP